MPERLLTPAAYITVLVILVMLTFLTVGLSFVPGPSMLHVVAGQSIAAIKAALVVLFFMHVLRSLAQTRAVIAVTIFWLLVVLLGLTLSDYFTRGMIPNLPGH
ncbi:MAG: cytochrome C oxidase subunit IV family protein [Thermoguttaceae bacterium]